MNDQSQMMNQHQMMNQLMVSQAQNPMMPPPQQQPVPVPVPQMVGQSYGQWGPNMGPPPPNVNLNYLNHMSNKNLNNNNNNSNNNNKLMYAKRSNNNNWKGKKAMDNGRKRKDRMMMAMMMNMPPGGGASSGGGVNGGGYQPPNLHELEKQNRLKARRFYPKKKFNNNGNNRMYAHAPRNTTSYLIRAKKAGGIASLVSPCPVTPAVLPTPVFSPSREALVDMAKEEWGVDGYGTMKGLIRLRSPGHDEAVDNYDEEGQEDEEGSSESDVEELEEVEKRLDHDLSRFEMINPNSHNLENRVDDQDTHIAQLEDENLFLKEKVYYLERELGDLTRRLLFLERQNQVVEDINEEVVDNVSDNDSDGVKGDGKGKPDFGFYEGERGMPIFANFADGGSNSEGDKVNAGDNKEGSSEDEKGVESAEGVKVEVADEDGKKQTLGDYVCMGEPVAEKVTECDQFEDKDGKSDGNLNQDEVVAGAAVLEDEGDKFKNDTSGDVTMGTH